LAAWAVLSSALVICGSVISRSAVRSSSRGRGVPPGAPGGLVTGRPVAARGPFGHRAAFRPVSLDRHEPVADVAHGADQRLVLGAELGPQPPDVDVDRARAAEVVVAPDLLQQLGAGEDPARMLGEELEQLEFLEGEVEDAAAQPGRVGRLVDGQFARACASLRLVVTSLMPVRMWRGLSSVPKRLRGITRLRYPGFRSR